MTEELEALVEDITAQHANPPEFCTCEKCHDKQIERIRIEEDMDNDRYQPGRKRDRIR